MSGKVLIVESPSKARSIQNYVKGYTVLATYGHVRDLLAKDGAVATDDDFAMKYVLIDRNKTHVDAIVKAVKKADTLLIATDPDREGEAIAWHVLEALKEKKVIKDQKIARVVFHQVTKKAVLAAIDDARDISMDLVHAQQARRALDFLVGFNLSPLLWRKIRTGLSAGRVQSPALRMIVEREQEIKKFEPKEYWSVEALCADQSVDFTAALWSLDQEKLKQFSLTAKKQVDEQLERLKTACQGQLRVKDVIKKSRKRNPPPPFTTSTLQQEASKKFRFGASKTMRVAQQLYEGIDMGTEQSGLITYMRTDSVTIGQDGIEMIREFVVKKYGQEALPESPRQFKTKSKNAQEAHEAIRPTVMTQTPDSLKSCLEPDQLKLYTLIWQRAVASQMQYALYDMMAIIFAGGEIAEFKTTGSTLKDSGYLRVYTEEQDDSPSGKDKTQAQDQKCPPLKVDDIVTLNDIVGQQHFTEPPPRFSEASLVKTLEEHDIGRPSTYASIISTLLSREYVVLEQRRFYPTDVGETVCGFLTKYFEQYVNYNFTAGLEDELDAIARGERQWIPVLKKFWDLFHKQVVQIDETVSRSDVTTQEIDEACPECGKPLSSRLGRRGRFIGCTGYPECSYTRSADQTAEEHAKEEKEDEALDRNCPECESGLIYKTGRYGKFIGCSAYPKCKHIESLEQPEGTGVTCPKCNTGEIQQRRSKRGKIFYSCNRYPKCKYAIWNEPLKQACSECEWPIMTLKTTKRSGTQHVCPECKHTVSIEDEGAET